MSLSDNAPEMESQNRQLRKEVERLKTQLSRYSMSAGHAEQRQAESRAMREALGFDPDAEDVSPNDLKEALALLIAKKQARALKDMVIDLLPIELDDMSEVRQRLTLRASNILSNAKEKQDA